MIFQQYSQEVLQFVRENPVAGGLIGVGSIGSVVAYCRNLPNRLYNFFYDQFTTHVEIHESDETYFWMDLFLSTLPSTKRSRFFYARRIMERHRKIVNNAPICTDNCEDSTESSYNFILTPGHGSHWIWHKGNLFIVSRGKEDGTAPSDSSLGSSQRMMFSRQIIKITTYGRSNKKAEKFIQDAADYIREFEKEETSIRILTWTYNGWYRSRNITHRTTNTLFMDNNIAERVIESAKKFIFRKKWYEDRSIPWRFGFGFVGKPGTGKTSLAIALATEIKRSIYILNLNSIQNDDTLINAISKIPQDAILLLEDIDAIEVTQERVTKGEDGIAKVSLSALLNSIDGVTASEGRILIITSNHPDKLDKALLRPGRIDRMENFEWISQETQARMFEHFYKRPDLVDAFRKVAPETICPAALQGIFIEYSEEPEKVLQKFEQDSTPSL